MAEVIENVITRFEVDVSQAVAALREYQKAQAATGKGADEVASQYRNRSRQSDDLQGRLRGLIAEERRENMMASFLGREIKALGFATNQTTGVLLDMGIALAGGLGIGLAIEAVKGAVILWRAWAEEARKVEDAHRKATLAIMEGEAETRKWLASLNKDQVSEWSRRVADETTTAFLKLAQAPELSLESIAKVRAEVERLRLDIESAEAVATASGLRTQLERMEAKLASLEAQRRAITAPLASTLAVQGEAESAVASAASAEARKQREANAQRLIAQAQEVGLDARQKAHLEYQRNLASVEESNASARAAAWRIYEGRLTEIARTEEEKRWNDYHAMATRQAAAEDEAERRETEAQRERERYETEHANRIFEIDYEMEQDRIRLAEESARRRNQILLSEVQNVAGIFTQRWLSAWSRSALVNKRYTAEYAKLSQERRADQLLEMGVVTDITSAKAMAAQEQAAAEAEKTAAEKQGIADRMAALAMEWGIKAIAAAADFNWGSAAAYAAAAAAAAALASKFHGEASRITAGRGLTAQERDSLTGGGLGGRSESDRRGGGAVADEGITRERVVIVIGDPFETPAETARRIARRMDLVERLDLRGQTVPGGTA